MTARSRTAGLEVHAAVQNANTATPGGFTLVVHGPPNAQYLILLDLNPSSVDTTFFVPGLIGALSLATPTILTLPGAFTTPSGLPPSGFLPATGEEALISTNSLPLGWNFTMFWQAIINNTPAGVPATPLNPVATVYASNPQTRRPVGPINAPSATGFQQGPALPATNAPNNRDIEQVDVDNDGDLDHFVLRTTVGQLFLQEPNGSDRRLNAYSNPIGLPAGMTAANSAEFADLDDDGWQDLIIGGSGNPYLAVYRNLGGIGLNPGAWLGFQMLTPQEVILLPQIYNVNDIETGDVDGDGLPDIVCSTGLEPCVGERNLLVMDRTAVTGSIQVIDETLLRMPTLLDDTEDGEFFDADGDGDLDIVFGNFDGPAPIEGVDFVFVNNGAGFYNVIPPIALPIPFGTTSETLDVLAEDFNFDGFDDIYVGNWCGNEACGQPYINIQIDQMLINEANGTPSFLDASFLLPDNPLYEGPTPSPPWATVDTEAVNMPLDATQSAVRIPKDYDHDGDVDIFIALGSFGLTNPGGAPTPATLPAQGITRGIVILQNQQVPNQGSAPSVIAFGLPYFVIDDDLEAAGALGQDSLPDYVDIEFGDWLYLNTVGAPYIEPWQWFEKDVGCLTINQGHFVHKKRQG